MTNTQQRFTAKRVVVTGAASGIGHAVAARFAAEGAVVVLVDRNPVVVDVAKALGQHHQGVVVDQTDRDAIAAFVAALAGPVDVLCANAGIGVPAMTVREMPYERWRRTIGVNLDGALNMAQAILRVMPTGQDASIVFTASTAGLSGYPHNADYAASKAALISMAKSLGLEVAGEGIRVNTVCPGGVRTPLIEQVHGSRAEQILADSAQEVPLGRIAEPEDIAAAIAFLASADARHITATTLIVDGGASARPS